MYIIGLFDRTSSANKIRISERCLSNCEGQGHNRQQLSRSTVCQAPRGPPETGSAPACREMERSERCDQTATHVRCRTTAFQFKHLQLDISMIYWCCGFFRCIQDRQVSVTELKFLAMDVELPEVSEDCLYLNIYTPVKPGKDAKLPVSSSTT